MDFNTFNIHLLWEPLVLQWCEYFNKYGIIKENLVDISSTSEQYLKDKLERVRVWAGANNTNTTTTTNENTPNEDKNYELTSIDMSVIVDKMSCLSTSHDKSSLEKDSPSSNGKINKMSQDARGKSHNPTNNTSRYTNQQTDGNNNKWRHPNSSYSTRPTNDREVISNDRPRNTITTTNNATNTTNNTNTTANTNSTTTTTTTTNINTTTDSIIKTPSQGKYIPPHLRGKT